MKLLEQHAREKINETDNWCIFRGEHINGGILLSGAVAPKFVKGDHKGEINWKRLDRSTEKKVFIPTEEHEKWLEQWEKQTGKCSDCLGVGTRVCGWSKADGQRYSKCNKCSGTGKSLLLRTECAIAMDGGSQ